MWYGPSFGMPKFGHFVLLHFEVQRSPQRHRLAGSRPASDLYLAAVRSLSAMPARELGLDFFAAVGLRADLRARGGAFFERRGALRSGRDANPDEPVTEQKTQKF